MTNYHPEASWSTIWPTNCPEDLEAPLVLWQFWTKSMEPDDLQLSSSRFVWLSSSMPGIILIHEEGWAWKQLCWLNLLCNTPINHQDLYSFSVDPLVFLGFHWLRLNYFLHLLYISIHLIEIRKWNKLNSSQNVFWLIVILTSSGPGQMSYFNVLSKSISKSDLTTFHVSSIIKVNEQEKFLCRKPIWSPHIMFYVVDKL